MLNYKLFRMLWCAAVYTSPGHISFGGWTFQRHVSRKANPGRVWQAFGEALHWLGSGDLVLWCQQITAQINRNVITAINLDLCRACQTFSKQSSRWGSGRAHLHCRKGPESFENGRFSYTGQFLSLSLQLLLGYVISTVNFDDLRLIHINSTCCNGRNGNLK